MKHLVALCCLLLALAAAVLLQRRLHPTGPSGGILVVYCAASLKGPVEQAAAAFRQAQDVSVQIQYGGSGSLLSQLRVVRKGDLFLAADAGALRDAEAAGLVSEVLPLALQHPVIAIRAGNPKYVQTLADLTRPDLRLALASPESASISRVTRTLLGPRWDSLASHAVVVKPTVTDVATDLRLGTVDAAIVWDSVVTQFPGLEAVNAPEISRHAEATSAVILRFAAAPDRARDFARFLADPARGGALLKAHGFTALPPAP